MTVNQAIIDVREANSAVTRAASRTKAAQTELRLASDDLKDAVTKRMQALAALETVLDPSFDQMDLYH
jgi:hypothetical protein